MTTNFASPFLSDRHRLTVLRDGVDDLGCMALEIADRFVLWGSPYTEGLWRNDHRGSCNRRLTLTSNMDSPTRQTHQLSQAPCSRDHRLHHGEP